MVKNPTLFIDHLFISIIEPIAYSEDALDKCI